MYVVLSLYPIGEQCLLEMRTVSMEAIDNGTSLLFRPLPTLLLESISISQSVKQTTHS